PGSWKGGMPAWSAEMRSASMSRPMTSWPSSAMAAACTAPRYPTPMTERVVVIATCSFRGGRCCRPEGWCVPQKGWWGPRTRGWGRPGGGGGGARGGGGGGGGGAGGGRRRCGGRRVGPGGRFEGRGEGACRGAPTRSEGVDAGEPGGGAGLVGGQRVGRDAQAQGRPVDLLAHDGGLLRGPEALQLAPGGVGAEVRDVQGGVAERGRVDVQQAGRCVRLPQDLLVVQVAVDEGRIGGVAESGEVAARGGDGPGAGRCP